MTTPTQPEFVVSVSNGAFWSKYGVEAKDAAEASERVLTVANAAAALDEEARYAGSIGVDPAGAYSVYDTQPAEQGQYSEEPQLIESGAEG